MPDHGTLASRSNSLTSPMQLAKPCLDVGLYTDRKAEMLAFYGDIVGLPYEEMLPVGGGVQQHRHGLNGSVLKINAARSALDPLPPSGYQRLWIARPDRTAVEDADDPDGNHIRLVPSGHDGITGIQIDIAVTDLAAHRRFWQAGMQAQPLADGRFQLGTTLIALLPGAAPRAHIDMRGAGWRYLTVQVFDVASEHARIVASGGREGRPPITLGEVARISFVRDPDGNWIEISQRRSLTGSLA